MTNLFPFQGAITDTEILNERIASGANKIISNIKLLESEINKFKASEKHKWMLTGEAYYEGDQEILKRKRKVIGKGGRLEVNENLPNNKILDNQYAKLVDQKVNYQLGKPITLESENKQYLKALETIFNRRFHRTLKQVGQDALNTGIGWLYPFYDENGEFTIKRFAPQEIIPFWKDSERSVVDFAIRIYSTVAYEGDKEVIVEKAEVYSANGVEYYEWFNGRLLPEVMNESRAYITVYDGETKLDVNWQRVPLIPFKFNSNEIPLIRRVKSLQDGINIMLSDFENNMQEDARNTILVLHNYDGQDLGEFRRNLSQYGAVKVRSADGAKGGVDTLTVTVNADNYKAILTLFKKALIENGRGYDAKDERMANNPNQMNIQSMYSDIELDANGIETEFQASFEQLLWFVNQHLANTGQGDFEGEKLDIVFNRDILINEKEVVEVLDKSPYLSNETKIAQHPYVKDVQLEQKRLKKEQQLEIERGDGYGAHFMQIQQKQGGDNDEV
ncbi:phage portal protein [Solibacillus sp. MA9]|uniref:Phage portal protein n=1 Tax=Solibacillus palustris TaxID=2908203 RepID=A0ABS9UBP1_9BACL|nr:phage portal protein [Solibacillus sp. MA9]MCH7321771.1 phage portal protein [Solibacillus sp. MA9]